MVDLCVHHASDCSAHQRPRTLSPAYEFDPREEYLHHVSIPQACSESSELRHLFLASVCLCHHILPQHHRMVHLGVHHARHGARHEILRTQPPDMRVYVHARFWATY